MNTQDNKLKDFNPAQFRFRDLFEGNIVFVAFFVVLAGATMLAVSLMNPIAPGLKVDDFCYSRAIYPIEFYPSLKGDVEGWLASGIPSYTGFDGSVCFVRSDLPSDALQNI